MLTDGSYMNQKLISPFFVALLVSTALQWLTIVLLWRLLPLNITQATKTGSDGRLWNITYVTHSDLPLLVCFGMLLLLMVLCVVLWQRKRRIALGLGLSVLPGLFLGLVYMMQDVG